MNMNWKQTQARAAPIPLPAPPSPPPLPTTISASRSPQQVVAEPHNPSPLSINFILPSPHPLPSSCSPIAELGRVQLADILPYEGAPTCTYIRAVEALSESLTRHNAAVIELGNEDQVVMRCALELARMFFKARTQCGIGGGKGSCGKSSRAFYTYRAGRALEDGDLSPPCMSDAFRCLSRVARAALSSLAKHLRLRSDVFNHLLDDTPLPINEVSSSMLVATYSNSAIQNCKGALGGKASVSEVEKGLLTIIASDHPGIQVCDPNGHWYLADKGSTPSDLLLLAGKALSHATAGLCTAASYRIATEYSSGSVSCGRTSLSFRLMPQPNAILDCSRVAAAGHKISQNFQPISVSQFMDDLSAEDLMCNLPVNAFETQNNLGSEPSLRNVLSDPLSGLFLEDAVVVSCGHSFGGHMLKKVIEVARCTICNAELDIGFLIPNLALRAAAVAVRSEDERRLFHNTTLRKRRKEGSEHMDQIKKAGKENGEIDGDGHAARHVKGVQFPFAVNEKVLIKGNRRTPDKFVGREAVITCLCLNGWYLLKLLDSGESVRLQYRSLQKLLNLQVDNSVQPLTLIQSNH